MKKSLLILIGLCTILSILIGMEINLPNNDFKNLKVHRQKKLIYKELPNALKFDLVNTKITLKPAIDKQYSISIEYYEKEKDDAQFGIAGNEFFAKSKTKSSINIVNIVAFIPENCKLNVGTVSGDIIISEMNQCPELRLSLTSGSAYISKISKINSLFAENVSGSIFISEILSIDNVASESVSGNISFDKVKKINQLQVESVSGDIEVLSSVIKSLDFDSVSGSLQISNSNIQTFVGETVSGDCTVEQSKITDSSFDSVSGKMRNK